MPWPRAGFAVTAVYVTSLKDDAAIGPLRDLIAAERPDVILNLTAFSAGLDGGGSVLDLADAPVFQLVLSGGGRPQWAESQRGLGPADLAMNVVLPEFDGRILAGAISFKGETGRSEALEFTRLAHEPEAGGIAHAADLAAAWVRLRRTPRAERRLACILSDYPAKGGRTGYAVGLDTPRSVIAIADRLAREGHDADLPDDETALIAALSAGETTAVLTLDDYERLFGGLPASFVADVRAAWGSADDDVAVTDGAFRFRVVRAGTLVIAVQPDRGDAASRKTEYHSPLLPPRHGYIAFYLWLRRVEDIHAMIHCGTHGTLEWLPGKAVALSEDCGPRAVLGATPLIYPFIVNNPGEAAQAKRRTAAVTVGHLTPPLTAAGAHGVAVELEGLFEEYSEAQSLDPRRAARLAELIMVRAHDTGLAAETGIAPGTDVTEALIKLDAWLCDLKDMRVGDGLHVFGQAPDAERRAETAASLAALSGNDTTAIERLLDDCGEAEMQGLLTALDGKFLLPGPAGAPARGRTDVLPTGRNLFGVDPRAVPTRTAWEIGRRTAEALLTRHAQDHGEWPKRVVLDIWGSATMRTGGDDLAQAFSLLGVRPRWDGGSNRVAGFDIMPLAVLNRPRIDVTLRISGLFRDVSFRTRLCCSIQPSKRSLRRKRRRRTIRWPPAFATAMRASACSARRPANMASESPHCSMPAIGSSATRWVRPISTPPRMPMAPMPRACPRRRRSATASPGPTPSSMFRIWRTRTCWALMLSPNMRAVSPPPPPRSATARRSITPIRPRPTPRKSARCGKKSPGCCAPAPPIRAGSPARCATAFAGLRKSLSPLIISSPTPH